MVTNINCLISVLGLRPHLCTLHKEEYTNGGIAIEFWHDDECFCEGSIWVPGLEEDEIAIPEYKYSGLLNSMLRAGLVQNSHRSVNSGYVTIPVCRMTEWLMMTNEGRDLNDATENFELNKEAHCFPDDGC